MKKSTDYAAILIGTTVSMLLDEYPKGKVKKMLSSKNISEIIKIIEGDDVNKQKNNSTA